MDYKVVLDEWLLYSFAIDSKGFKFADTPVAKIPNSNIIEDGNTLRSEHGFVDFGEIKLAPEESITLYYDFSMAWLSDNRTVGMPIATYFDIEIEEPNFYSIETEAVNGVVDETLNNVVEGFEVTVNYEPNEGYELDKVIIDDVEQDIEQYKDSYTFTDVHENHKVQVSYKETEVVNEPTTPATPTMPETTPGNEPTDSNVPEDLSDDSVDVSVKPEQTGTLGSTGTSNPANYKSDTSSTQEANSSQNNGVSETEPIITADAAIEDGLVPSTTIGKEEVPLYNNGIFTSWSLMNLVLCVAGALIALIAIMRNIIAERNGEYNAKSHVAVTGLFAIAGIALFLITQDTSSSMTLVDMWTIPNVVLFCASVISMILAFRKNKEAIRGTR
jgi:hypothetical protein